jgi:hypothetical protein
MGDMTKRFFSLAELRYVEEKSFIISYLLLERELILSELLTQYHEWNNSIKQFNVKGIKMVLSMCCGVGRGKKV